MGRRSQRDNDVIKFKRPMGSSRNAPAIIGAVVFAFVFIYLCVNLYIYWTKDQVSIYEVQAESLNFATGFDAVCIRNEELVESAYSGYVNYYVGQGNKVAKNAVVYSVDGSGSNIYKQLSADYSDIIFTTDEINQVKSIIGTAMRNYDGTDVSWSGAFSDKLSDDIDEIVNTNLLDRAKQLVQTSSSNTDFYPVRVPKSGIVSYKTDSLFGITAGEVVKDIFEDNNFSEKSLKSTGLVSKGEFVYRLCQEDTWSIVAMVDEDFYVNNLENHTATIFINGGTTPMSGEMKLMRHDDDYFAEVVLSDCMSEFIDTRFVKVEFSYDTENGLKIPLSSVVSKEFFLVPLSMFTAQEGYDGYVLQREIYDAETGEAAYEDIYTSKYFSDGYYAYLDKSVVNDGDYLVNRATNERCRVGSVNSMDGVYCVNKGYYVFTRIERIKSNSEYVIVKKNTVDGLRLYDHIALNSNDAVEGKIIY